MYTIIQMAIRPWRNEEQEVDKEKKRYYARMAVLQSLISPWKKEEEKKKKQKEKQSKLLLHGGIRIWSPMQVLTQPSRA